MEYGLAILSIIAIVALLIGAQRAMVPDTSAIDERLRRYGVRRLGVAPVEMRKQPEPVRCGAQNQRCHRGAWMTTVIGADESDEGIGREPCGHSRDV